MPVLKFAPPTGPIVDIFNCDDMSDAAQERGELVGSHNGARKRVPDENAIMPATAEDIGLTRKDIYEAQRLKRLDKDANIPRSANLQNGVS